MSKKTIYRNSETGRLTSKEYSDKHPKTTEKEVVKVTVAAKPARKK